MIIRSKKGTNEKFAIQNELQNLKNFYRKIKDSLRDTYQNWKNRYGRSYQGKDVTRSTMFWTAQKQFFQKPWEKFTHTPHASSALFFLRITKTPLAKPLTP